MHEPLDAQNKNHESDTNLNLKKEKTILSGTAGDDGGEKVEGGGGGGGGGEEEKEAAPAVAVAESTEGNKSATVNKTEGTEGERDDKQQSEKPQQEQQETKEAKKEEEGLAAEGSKDATTSTSAAAAVDEKAAVTDAVGGNEKQEQKGSSSSLDDKEKESKIIKQDEQSAVEAAAAAAGGGDPMDIDKKEENAASPSAAEAADKAKEEESKIIKQDELSAVEEAGGGGGDPMDIDKKEEDGAKAADKAKEEESKIIKQDEQSAVEEVGGGGGDPMDIDKKEEDGAKAADKAKEEESKIIKPEEQSTGEEAAREDSMNIEKKVEDGAKAADKAKEEESKIIKPEDQSTGEEAGREDPMNIDKKKEGGNIISADESAGKGGAETTASSTIKKDSDEKAEAAGIDKDENNMGVKSEIAQSGTGGEPKTVVSCDSKAGKDSQQKSKTAANSTTSAAAADSAQPAAPPPPVMKGTLSYDKEQRRHLIRGMWNYENQNGVPNELSAQRFELLRNLAPDEEVDKLPQDGEFHGSFSLAYFHVTSKGKRKERSKVIPENGVNIKFKPVEGKQNVYTVQGKGTNQFGVFHIEGTAKPSTVEGDPTLHLEFKKRYEPAPTPPATGAAENATNQGSKKSGDADNNGGSGAEPLPPPAKSYASGVVCLRGKLFKQESADLGLTEVIHKITGMWASGLDFLLADPENTRKLANKFEYEHKSSVSTNAFPVSGRYSGWFDLTNEDGTRTKINERDVTLKFRKNNAGYYNVEGRGSNLFGKYSITGTLTDDNVITIFRHFQPRKVKQKSNTGSSGTAQVPGSGAGPAHPAARRPSVGPVIEAKLKLDDVKLPPEALTVTDNGESQLEPMKPPEQNAYSAVSRGILRANGDGSFICNGKWAVTREHFTNGQTSNFSVRLEAHFATEALAKNNSSGESSRTFPLDSDMYKGSFQLKKQGGGRYQTIIDQQVVMKFRKNSLGSFNVYGKGINAIGEFNLVGTLILSGRTAGQVELYRTYPPEKLLAPKPAPAPKSTDTPATTADGAAGTAAAGNRLSGPLPGPPPTQLVRRESTRMIKLPSKLEDDDPSAMLSRTMTMCTQLLRMIREKDVELGAFFSEPVDPVALGIPTYHQIIKEPMDLRTVHRRMESGSLDNPEEFVRLVRLVFENAITFNIDPGHSVHQAARNLLGIFNQKIPDVERLIQKIKVAKGAEQEGKGKKKLKEETKKRKRQQVEEPPKSLKKQRQEEALAMATTNQNALSRIVAAAPAADSPHVTRAEFGMLLTMIRQLQQQIVDTHKALAELSPGDESDAKGAAVAPSSKSASSAVAAPAAKAPATAPERKKSVKRKSEPAPAPALAPVLDDSRPLTLEEQELLTDTINDLPHHHLGTVIQIIREAAPVGADEDEIDLEIDQLDTKTQRKLLRHVTKFTKKGKAKPKTKKTKQTQSKKSDQAAPRKGKAASTPAPAPSPPPAPAAPSQSKRESFFAFGGGKGDSDDSDSEEDEPTKTGTTLSQPPGGKTLVSESSKDFQLGAGLGDLHDEHDDDLGNGGLAANWSIPKPADKSEKDGGDEEEADDAWGAAREHAAVAKQREAERKAREEKMKAEAEALKEQRFADAAARAEEISAQQAKKQEEEAKLEEQKEKEAEEARESARAAARKATQSVEQTIDLDEQRDLMKQYEQSFLDKDLGSASPSSDFGF